MRRAWKSHANLGGHGGAVGAGRATGTIIDVQRFGGPAGTAGRTIPKRRRRSRTRRWGAHGLKIDDLRLDEPTLREHVCGDTARLGQNVQTSRFPGRHDHRAQRGGVAIGATNLTKAVGSFTA